MAETTISGLPALAAVADAMVFEVESLGSNRKVTHLALKTDILTDPDIIGTTTFFNDLEIVEEATNPVIRSLVIDKEMKFYCNDGGADTNIITLEAADPALKIMDGASIKFGNITVAKIYLSANDLYIENVSSDQDIVIKVNDGGVNQILTFFDGSTSRVGIGVDFVTPEGILHVFYDSNPEVPLFERATAAIANAQSVHKFGATSLNNMGDGFGPMCTFVITDDALVRNVIALFGGVRDGADNSGRLIFGTYAAGVAAENFRIAADGGIYAFNLLGAAPAANPDVYWDSVSSELFYNSSSIDYKKNVEDAVLSDVNWIYQSKIRKYDRKLQDHIKGELGFIAEELELINPKYVGKKCMNIREINQCISPIGDVEPKTPPEPIMKIDSVSLSSMVPSLILAIQELKKEIDVLKAK